MFICVCVFRWISVLSNSKQEALNVALDGGRRGGESSVEDLTQAITEDIRRMPGNGNCCDCGAPGNVSQSVSQSIHSISILIPTCLQPHLTKYGRQKNKQQIHSIKLTTRMNDYWIYFFIGRLVEN